MVKKNDNMVPEQSEPQIKKSQVPPAESEAEVTILQKLIALYSLQLIDSKIDRIRIVRGELPLEVQDLEDEIIGLETRISNYNEEIAELKSQILEKKNTITEAQALIKKYEEQQMNVRNNREYDSLSKEIEFQTLDIQLSEKRIKEYTATITIKEEEVEKANLNLADLQKDLELKKSELDTIVAETEKDEQDLENKSIEQQRFIEDRLLLAYKRIRKNARNGLAVCKVERDACGGCFNKIPPQRQLDIRIHKKIIVCEYCGRILVDDMITDTVDASFNK
ncbi:MAG: C4-type zinc ribbon domain-containing protein [Bacteroidales bacterium]|nr:C4-type zinc ribbon domain-containing protein [Bacteroidales bacterium]MDD3960229.1 C4-type zinc ribbon domain-containing protein [Bacteroidales bacterium]MDY0286186.1 C4-type zinc ribbon domain-containing protein [Bacteroidales bacterium]